MQERLDKVTSLALEITSYCNVRCPQCGRTSYTGTFADEYLRLKHWRVDQLLPNLQLDRLRNLKFARMEGDNGDALMHPAIEKIIDAIYHAPANPDIVIFTNGSLRSEDWWFQLGQKFPRLIVQFSIDGLADTNHLYRIGTDYNKIIANAKAFIAGGGVATTRCIVFKHNEHQLEEIRDVSRQIGFKWLVFMPNDVSRFQGQDHWEVYDNGKKLHDIYPSQYSWDDLKRYSYKDIRFSSNIGGPIMDFICPTVAAGEVTVTYLGHIIPCCMVNVDYDFKHPQNDQWREIIGDRDNIDLHKRPLGEILTDPGFYHHRLERTLMDGNLYHRCESFCKKLIDARVRSWTL